MSQENVDNLRAFIEAWIRGEGDMSLLGPEVTYEDAILPDHLGETYRGIEGVAWAQCGARSRARHTGIEAELRYAYVWIFREGRVIHSESVRDPLEALEVVGLRE